MIDTRYNAILRQRSAYGERNDCTVMAIATAFELSYAIAHDLLTCAGRKPYQGFWLNVWLDARTPQIINKFKYERIGLPVIDPTKHYILGVTLTQFRRDFPEGRFILQCRGHVFTYINGKTFNLWTGARTRITAIWHLEAL